MIFSRETVGITAARYLPGGQTDTLQSRVRTLLYMLKWTKAGRQRENRNKEPYSTHPLTPLSEIWRETISQLRLLWLPVTTAGPQQTLKTLNIME